MGIKTPNKSLTPQASGQIRAQAPPYTYTIFDRDPKATGSEETPWISRVPIHGALSTKAVLRYACAEARAVGRECGEYRPGDYLWVRVYKGNTVVLEGGVTLHARGGRKGNWKATH